MTMLDYASNPFAGTQFSPSAGWAPSFYRDAARYAKRKARVAVMMLPDHCPVHKEARTLRTAYRICLRQYLEGRS